MLLPVRSQYGYYLFTVAHVWPKHSCLGCKALPHRARLADGTQPFTARGPSAHFVKLTF